ncbi:hypothetical protein O0L34_g45 [Tuta absoluta]|nr:hypothetical protein O0L34_g45 [Tuta absoluta]
MAITRIESALEELLNTVKVLSEKVTNLESKISVQYTIISTQTQTVHDLKSIIERDSNIPVTVITPQHTAQSPDTQQRPIRKARIRATNALDALNLKTKDKSVGNRSAKSKPTGTSNSSDQQTQSGATKPTAFPDACDNTNKNNVLPRNDDVPQQLHDDHQDQNEWKTVEKKRKTQKIKIGRSVVKGSGSEDSDLQTVERVKRIHACFFKPETETANLLNFMKKKNPSNDYMVEQIKLKHNHYASFSITVPTSKFNFFMDAALWPPGTEISEWFQRSKGRAKRSSTRFAAGRSTNAANLGAQPRAQ